MLFALSRYSEEGSVDRRNMGESRSGTGPACGRKGAVGRYCGPSSFIGSGSSMTCGQVWRRREHRAAGLQAQMRAQAQRGGGNSSGCGCGG